MTAFSDFPPPADHPLHPEATQIRAYLRDYAARFGVTPRIRLESPVRDVRPGWTVDGEPFDAVVVASGRFRRPHLPPGLDRFGGEVLHAFDYPGAEPFRDRATLVVRERHQRDRDRVGPRPGRAGRLGVPQAAVRDPEGRRRRLVGLAVVHALRRARAPPAPAGRVRAPASGTGAARGGFAGGLRRPRAGRGHPRRRARALSGLPRADPDGAIECRPAIAAIDGHTVTFADGTSASVRGDRLRDGVRGRRSVPPPGIRELLGPDLALVHRTLHPDLPGLGVVGQFLAQGPYFPLLELQARWIVGVWAGDVVPPEDAAMRRALAEPAPALETHNALAATLAEQAGVAPDLEARPDLAEPLLFGPMLPPRYRLDGPGAQPEAEARFREQLAASPALAGRPGAGRRSCAPSGSAPWQRHSRPRLARASSPCRAGRARAPHAARRSPRRRFAAS